MPGDINRDGGGGTSDPAELADTDQAGQPAPPATDDDYAEPGGDAPITTPAGTSPSGTTPAATTPSGGASRVGERGAGDTDDIGSTDAMTSSTGGLAGTSR